MEKTNLIIPNSKVLIPHDIEGSNYLYIKNIQLLNLIKFTLKNLIKIFK